MVTGSYAHVWAGLTRADDKSETHSSDADHHSEEDDDNYAADVINGENNESKDQEDGCLYDHDEELSEDMPEHYFSD